MTTRRQAPSRRPPFILQCAIVAAVAGGPAPLLAATPDGPAAAKVAAAKAVGKRAYYLRFASGQSAAAEQALQAQGGEVTHRLPAVDSVAVLLPEPAAAALAAHASVALLEPVPEHALKAQRVPWNIDQVQARDLWDGNRDGVIDGGAPTGSGIKVCIIDTGFYRAHADFQGISVDGVSQITGENWFEDGNGHGSHVAGTLNAVHNDIGVVGVMPGGAELFIVKIFANDGLWKTGQSNLGAAATACRNAGANVVSMSLGGAASSTEEAIFQAMYDTHGIVNVAAAGNDGDNTRSYPASYESVISVGAVDEAELAADFSQYPTSSLNPASPPANAEWDVVELAGGGVDVPSTWPGDYFVTAAGNRIDAIHLEGTGLTPPAGLTGPLASGGLCTAGNAAWSGRIVLCERGDISFQEKANFVRTSGGTGVVIYNNVAGGFAGTCDNPDTGANECAGYPPGLTVSQADGQTLLAQVGSTLGMTATNGVGCSGASCLSSYQAISGTSMATPGVAAGLGFVWNACGGPTGITNKQLRLLLRETAKDLSGTQPGSNIAYGAGWDRVTGWGLIQLADAQARGHALYGSTCPLGLAVTPAAAEVCGLDGSASFTVTLDEQFQGSATLADGGTAPAGSSGSFSPNPVVHPVKDSLYTLSNLANVASGIHALTFTATDAADPSNSAEGVANISLFADLPPSIPLLAPAAGATGVGITPTFSWGASSEASSYVLEVSTSADFSTIVHAQTLTGTSHALTTALASNTVHYWRVRAGNACGSTSSVVRSFTTANVVCTVVPSSDVPKAIADASGNPNNPTPVVTTSALTSAVSGALVDLDVVALNGTHTYIGDLSFDLRSPANSTVQIMANACTSTDDFNLGLDDEAAGSAGGWPCPPVGGGSYRPSNPLSAFDGQAASGSWSLRITDSGKNDTGMLQGWGLRLCVVAPVSNTPPVANADSHAATEDTTLVVGAPGVLANDTDAQSQPLTAALVSGVASGTLSLAANGGFSYTPAANFCGNDSFVYRANDGQANSADATVAVAVECVNDAPHAVGTLADQLAMEGEQVSYPTAPAFADRDTGDVLAFSASGLPASLSIDAATGAISGTLATGSAQDGPYLVTVTASDGAAGVALQFTLSVLAGGPVGSDIFRDGFED